MKHIFPSPISSAAIVMMTVSCMSSDFDKYYEDINYSGTSQNPAGGDRYEKYEDNPFIETSENNVSTFSVDADGASYANMRRYIVDEKRLPDRSSVRIEEFLNYFTFEYDEPSDGKNVAINAEVSGCPWNKEHKLIRLGLKGKQVKEEDIPAANYVFLIDVSGSMNTSDKISLLKQGLMTLVDHLRPDDRVSIITYSGNVTKLLESTLAGDSEVIKEAIRKLVASGATAGGEAMKMAYEEAIANYIEGGNNRIIMGMDGDFNVGVTDIDTLVEMVESYAEKGIYLTICGFGRGNLNDAMMEKVSNRGNGTYEYIDSEGEMTKVFVNERAKFYSVANDSKIRVTFNKDAVKSYRLIGYENRTMSGEDFDDDRKDAGEIGAGQTITALYEIIPAEGYNPDMTVCGTFDLKYKETTDADSSIQISIDITDNGGEMSENTSFAAGVAAFGMILRKSPYRGEATFDMAGQLAKDGMSFDPYGYRREFIDIIGKAKNL